jgi:hypothetical protein
MTTAAISATPARARAVPPASRRPGLPGTLRSELTKILSVRSTYWTLLAQAVASIDWAVLNCAGTVAHGHGPEFNAAEASLTGRSARPPNGPGFSSSPPLTWTSMRSIPRTRSRSRPRSVRCARISGCRSSFSWASRCLILVRRRPGCLTFASLASVWMRQDTLLFLDALEESPSDHPIRAGRWSRLPRPAWLTSPRASHAGTAGACLSDLPPQSSGPAGYEGRAGGVRAGRLTPGSGGAARGPWPPRR